MRGFTASLRIKAGKFLDSDLFYSFRTSPMAIAALAMFMVLALLAIFAPLVTPQNPLDQAALDLLNSELPPAWERGGDPAFLLGTDHQGRDVLSSIIFGLRISLLVGAAGMVFALVIGVVLGLIAGFVGGFVDAFIMRLADIKLSFPAILIALLINGVLRTLLPDANTGVLSLVVLIAAIGLSGWVQYARVVRGLTLIEKEKEYVQAAGLIGQGAGFVIFRHILPNAFGPISVLSTINFALAILTEATLSFLGAGVPPTEPSLGTLVRIGNEYLFSGLWWIAIFPSVALVFLVLSVNILGDWLRDALNPRLK